MCADERLLAPEDNAPIMAGCLFIPPIDTPHSFMIIAYFPFSTRPYFSLRFILLVLYLKFVFRSIVICTRCVCLIVRSVLFWRSGLKALHSAPTVRANQLVNELLIISLPRIMGDQSTSCTVTVQFNSLFTEQL